MKLLSSCVAGLATLTLVPTLASQQPAPASSGQADRVYYASELTIEARPVADNPVPQYPDSLRAARVGGLVLAQWVVDTSGIPQMSTFKIVRSPYKALSDAVRAAVEKMRYEPARFNGKKVRELLQVPFDFQHR